MLNKLELRDVPHTHEIEIDTEKFLLKFILCPELNEFLCQTLKGNHLSATYYTEKLGLANFIEPNDKGWGYGDVFRLSKEKPKNGWVAWEIELSDKPGWKRLDEIAATINDLSSAIALFDDSSIKSKENQFFMIDSLRVGFQHTNGGALWFAFSREVLEYTPTIWGKDGYDQGEKYRQIIDCMKKVYAKLTGREKKDMDFFTSDFHIGIYRGEPRCPTFRCPGNCACIGPSGNFNPKHDEYGASYSPHNVDTKTQQFTLLAGAIKLANMARQKL